MNPTTQSPKTQKTGFAFALVVTLFFLWALTSNLLSTLIPHLRKACRLDYLQSTLIDFAYWTAYFVMAIPAAMVMRKYSYKTGIICGLVIATIGSGLFYPAAEVRQFGLFLSALFLMASGMAFLETAANPYITILGKPETSSQRLNFAQAFNGLGAFVATFFLSKMILSGVEYTPEQLNAMSPADLEKYLSFEATRVQLPYLGIAIVLLLVAVLFYVVKMPDVPEEKDSSFKLEFSVFKRKHFTHGVIAQFFYVGAQVCISSLFIPYVRYTTNISEQTINDNHYLGYLLLCFMVGRYFGTFLMRKVKPNYLLTIYAVCNILLLAYCVMVASRFGIYAMMGVEFFMSIMFPTIFALGIKDLGNKTKVGSSFMVMSIVGGALIPLLVGYIAKHVNIQIAYVVPLVCFLYVFYYGWKGYIVEEKPVVARELVA
ncbi:MAG: L-fucose:H+ symporter permease [Bacteroidetes bacterium]|nr:L-fucose:H+ symporter permease [Bacteroidota bacterium]